MALGGGGRERGPKPGVGGTCWVVVIGPFLAVMSGKAVEIRLSALGDEERSRASGEDTRWGGRVSSLFIGSSKPRIEVTKRPMSMRTRPCGSFGQRTTAQTPLHTRPCGCAFIDHKTRSDNLLTNDCFCYRYPCRSHRRAMIAMKWNVRI